MARPLSTPEPHRGGINGDYQGSAHPNDLSRQGGQHRPADGPGDNPSASGPEGGADGRQELEHLRAENAQLRSLCGELEQALQEAAQPADPQWEARVQEYEMLLEEKSDMIRQLHQQLQGAEATVAEAGAARPRAHDGPAPREEELLSLSEQLEHERRQLQEDEQALMEQMRQMEVGMARERAELARQRNELQRLRSEIAHELERLERNGALQNKMDSLKSKLQDANTRRGAAPSSASLPALPADPDPAPTPPVVPSKSNSLMGRLFGQGGSR
jgi:hypothetical protein